MKTLLCRYWNCCKSKVCK